MKKILIILALTAPYANAMLRRKGVQPVAANTDSADRELIDAISENDVKKVEQLIKIANINHVCDLDYTPLMYAVISDKIEIIRLLLENKANAKIKNNHGATALQLACLRSKDKNIIDLLLKAKSNINTPDDLGTTPLMAAITTNSEDIVDILLSRAPLVNSAKDKYNDTALNVAIKHNNPEITKSILAHTLKSELNARNRNGFTPLMLALKKSSFEIIKMLLDAGCDPSMQIYNDDQKAFENCYDMAKRYTSIDDENIPQVKEFFKQIEDRQRNIWIDFFKLDLRSNSLEDFIKVFGEKPQSQFGAHNLLFLVKNCESLSQLVLQRNIDVKETFVEILNKLKRCDEAANLVRLGANINYLGKDGETILCYAITNKFSNEILTDLIKLGADINILSRKNKTPIVIAAESGNMNAVKLLKDLGCAIDENTISKLFDAALNNTVLLEYLKEQAIYHYSDEMYSSILKSANNNEKEEREKVVAEKQIAKKQKSGNFIELNIGNKFKQLGNMWPYILTFLNDNDLAALRSVNRQAYFAKR